MLLFEHKQHLQIYNAQSSKQRKIFALKKKGLQQMAGRDYKTLFQG